MSTAEAREDQHKLTKCVVCSEVYAFPKVLPCGHLLCRDCLTAVLQSQPPAGCPLCRCPIVDPAGDQVGGRRSIEAVADDFPTDLAMTAMVEAETLLSSQHMCGVCVDVAAEALCLQCLDLFCAQCSRLHRRQAVSRHHEVEELATLTAERLAAYHPATCPVHKGERASEVYCPDHGVSVCLLCAATVHRQCPRVVSLRSRAEEASKELVQIMATISAAEASVDASLGELNEFQKDLQTDSQAALEERKRFCDRLKEAIDARCLQISQAIASVESDVTDDANVTKSSLLRKRTVVTAHKTIATLYKSFKGHQSFLDMVALVKGRVQELDADATLPDSLEQKPVVTFERQAAERFEEQLKLLGTAVVEPKAKTARASTRPF